MLINHAHVGQTCIAIGVRIIFILAICTLMQSCSAPAVAPTVDVAEYMDVPIEEAQPDMVTITPVGLRARGDTRRRPLRGLIVDLVILGPPCYARAVSAAAKGGVFWRADRWLEVRCPDGKSVKFRDPLAVHWNLGRPGYYEHTENDLVRILEPCSTDVQRRLHAGRYQVRLRPDPIEDLGGMLGGMKVQVDTRWHTFELVQADLSVP